jgi:membrane-associated phospholipid phosphatase
VLLLLIVVVAAGTVALLVAFEVRHGWLSGRVRSRFRPDATRALALTLSAVVIGLCAVLIGSLIYLLRDWPRLAAADLAVARWAAGHATAASTSVLRAVTQLGSTLVVILAGATAAAVATIRSRRAVPIVFVAFVIAGQSLIVHLVKVVVGRPRPSVAVLTGFHGQSFPSGHSAAAAACWGAVAIVLAQSSGRRVRGIAYGAAAGVAVAVACSRVFLGVHWTSDVIAGLGVGWSWLALCAICFGGRLLVHDPAVAPDAEGSVPVVPSKRGGTSVGVDEGVVHQAPPGAHPPADGGRSMGAQPSRRP